MLTNDKIAMADQSFHPPSALFSVSKTTTASRRMVMLYCKEYSPKGMLYLVSALYAAFDLRCFNVSGHLSFG